MHVNEKDNNDDDDGRPKVAWLMSFPNISTTYTNYLVQAVSGYNSASNYGMTKVQELIHPYGKRSFQMAPFIQRLVMIRI